MTKAQRLAVAVEIVHKIIRDLSGSWDSVDICMQAEIRQEWQEIVVKVLAKEKT